jgi:hypothetical protein
LSEPIKPKKKQGPKPGKVMRLQPAVLAIIQKHRKPGEREARTVRRLMEQTTDETFFAVLTSDTACKTIEEARGLALKLKVKLKLKQTPVPTKVTVLR